MWVARDKKNNQINLFLIKPVRDKVEGIWHTDDWEYPESEFIPIYDKMFPDLKWEDDPVEVSLVSTEFVKKYSDEQKSINEEELNKLVKTEYPDDEDDEILYGVYLSNLRNIYRKGCLAGIERSKDNLDINGIIPTCAEHGVLSLNV